MIAAKRPRRDAKTILQEWAQGRGLPPPYYRELERSGPHHRPLFRVVVELPDMAAIEGSGSTKREAEQAAAAAMLARMKVAGAGGDV
jgi:ribonuclease-3